MRGIAGLQGREPIGAVLSVGIKGPSGNPIDKDMFHLLQPKPDAQMRRHPHPRFRAFNTAPKGDRTTVLCQLVHQREEQCFSYHLKAYRPPGQPMHPRKAPFCTGDGERARRYTGLEAPADFDNIACLHDKCEFRQRQKTGRGLGPAHCKPWARLLFRIVWRAGNMPSMLVQWTTASWASTGNALGMFNLLRDQAEMVLGGRSFTLGGFTFLMTLGEGTNAAERTRFPVVTFTPEMDPMEFFMAQVDRYERIGSVMGPAPAVAALEHITDGQDAEDYLSHEPGVK